MRTMKNSLIVFLIAGVTCASAAAGTAIRRPLNLGDLYSLREVADPRISPDGDWVAYTVTSIDAERDSNNNDLWMTSWDGARTVQLTHTPESEHTPRWSPDGRRLAFLSGRAEAKGTDQLWLLDRDGGEAECVTDLAGGVSDFAWSPDAKRLVLVSEVSPDSPREAATRRSRS